MNSEQKENLKILADYLYELPEEYENFDMISFAAEVIYLDGGIQSELDLKTYGAMVKKGNHCGTVACAGGHGILAGILPDDNMISWTDYIEGMFGCTDTIDANYTWMFDENWSYKDNTTLGAALRIYWLLEKGCVPNDYLAQVDEPYYPLSYKDWTPECKKEGL